MGHWPYYLTTAKLASLPAVPTKSIFFPLPYLIQRNSKPPSTRNTNFSNPPPQVTDTRPPGLRPNYTDVSAVPKYELPPDAYEARTDSVLAWKKANHLGRFDPAAPSIEEQKAAASYREVAERHIALNARCRLLPDADSRRGTVRFVGDVGEIPGVGAWIGVELDEPTGKNDGSVKGTRYFECRGNCGVFVRPERVEVGEFEVLDELGEDEEF